MKDDRPGTVYGIYHVDRPEVIEYVGQTVSTLESRRKGHIYDATSRAYKSTIPMHNFIRKYGQEAVKIRALRHCTGHDELNRVEEEVIAEYRAAGQARLNVRAGGSSSPMSPESREKSRRRFSGQNSPVTKLTWIEVNEARRRYVQGDDIKELQKLLGVSSRQTDRILRNAQWVDPNYVVPERRSLAVFSLETATRVREEAMTRHVPRAELASKYGVSKVLIEKVLHNKLWEDPEYDPSALPKVTRGGERIGTPKGLTDRQVSEIRARFDAGEKVSMIAGDFLHVTYSTVRSAAKRINAYKVG